MMLSGGDLSPPPPPPQSPTPSELNLIVRGRKKRIAWIVVMFILVEVVVCVMSIDRLARAELEEEEEGDNVEGGVKVKKGKGVSSSIVVRLEKQDEEDDDVDSGVIEVILFALPFMLVTNLLVLVALARDNVWLLLPWMVLHCVVVAFLTLGAAILSVHRRYFLGSIALLSALLLLCCWKALRQLFMKMVDRQLKLREAEANMAFLEGANAIEEEEPSKDFRHRQELIFFGSKDRKFNMTAAVSKGRVARFVFKMFLERT